MAIKDRVKQLEKRAGVDFQPPEDWPIIEHVEGESVYRDSITGQMYTEAEYKALPPHHTLVELPPEDVKA